MKCWLIRSKNGYCMCVALLHCVAACLEIIDKQEAQSRLLAEWPKQCHAQGTGTH